MIIFVINRYVEVGGIPSVSDGVTDCNESVTVGIYNQVTHRNILGFLIR